MVYTGDHFELRIHAVRVSDRPASRHRLRRGNEEHPCVLDAGWVQELWILAMAVQDAHAQTAQYNRGRGVLLDRGHEPRPKGLAMENRERRRRVGRRDYGGKEERTIDRPTKAEVKDAEHHARGQHDAPRRHPACRERHRPEDAAFGDEATVEQDEHQARVGDLICQFDVVEVPQPQDIAAGQEPEPESNEDDGYAEPIEPNGRQQQERSDDVERLHQLVTGVLRSNWRSR